MSAAQKLVWVFGGIVALLTLASAIGWLLARRKGETGTIRNLNERVRAWWIMVAVLGTCFWLGADATLVVFAFISFFALREFITLTPTRASDHKPLAVAFYVLVPLQYWLIHLEWYGLFSIFIPVYAFLGLPALAVFAGDTEDFLERTTKIQWGVMITVYCISYAPALLVLDLAGFEDQGALLLLYLMLVVQISDVMQYVFGKLFGKRKLAPLVSPSKTVEGLIGGGLAATGIGAAMYWITPFTPLQSAAMSLLIVICGVLGGLALSAVKRSLGAKDWGSMIEGHGGMMDRMDSVSFAAPIFFHIARFFFSN
ncbi:MAG TPA: phosphatidate cytidylyltransferase [Tahibacter sp.]|uniref:phosphatidate cytidylyltransferase n=1 Tax=Tahibacter sp. TaxID=2056211 RepID=UPI002C09EE0C|nr:phosphatidate cytidylyltransferase [Tahibacter sp.]HSX59185.1 phosphatidate cytidylyltransferase [Tahibacter sp.]